MTLDDYTRLADDGCPNCPEHVAGFAADSHDGYRHPLPHLLAELRRAMMARLLVEGLLR